MFAPLGTIPKNSDLDLHEMRFALNAFGLFPTLDYIEDWMDGEDGLDRPHFKSLLKQKLASAPSWMRGSKNHPCQEGNPMGPY